MTPDLSLNLRSQCFHKTSALTMEKKGKKKSIFNVFWMCTETMEDENYQNNLQLNYNMYALKREA